MSYDIFIDDGYTQVGYIAATPKHGSIKFDYRPTLYAEREVISDQLKKAKPGEAGKLVATMLAKHVVSWSADRDISAENIAKLRPDMLDKMYFIVMGVEPSDELPGGEQPAGYSEQQAVKN